MKYAKHFAFIRFFAWFFSCCILLSCTKEGDVGPRGLDGLSGSRIHSGSEIPNMSIGLVGDYYFQTSSGDFYGPKTSDSWGAPTNLRGMEGAKGAAGTTGATGPRGASILSGTSNPSSNLGNIGDFYLNMSNSDLYGPKTANGWGEAINLKGANGTKIHNGTGVPASTLGIDGDYYYRTTTGQLYGPKVNTSWGLPINLIGTPGKDGSNGIDGKTIHNGTGTPASTLGTLGDFYYRTANGDFYGPKTANGWGSPINLKGTNGQQGEPGSQILSGTSIPDMKIGRLGDFYFNTSTSDFYGPKGATSWNNPINLRGARGATGADGKDGSKIISRIYSPHDTIGNVGDYFINISNGQLFGPKTNAGWGTYIVNLRGVESSVYYSDWKKLDATNDINEGKIYVPIFQKHPEYLDNAVIIIYVQEYKDFDFTAPIGGFRTLDYYSNAFNFQVWHEIQRDGFLITWGGEIDNSLHNRAKFRYVIIPGNVKVD